MAAFSRPRYMENALKHKLIRNRTLAGGNVKGAIANPDFTIKHLGWVRDAGTKNFGVMDKAIMDEHKKNFADAMIRRNKLVGK